jgi:hypothetical protein
MLAPLLYADPATVTASIDFAAEVRPAPPLARPPLPSRVVLDTVGGERALPPVATPPPPPTALQPLQPAAAIPFTPAELTQQLEDVGLGGTVVETRVLDSRSYGSVSIEAGTRVSLHLQGSTLALTSTPGLLLDLSYGPKVRIENIHYDLTKGEFDVDAHGPGLDFVYQPIASFVANHYLRELLPEQLQRPGYEPRGDQAVERGVIELIGNLLTGKPGPGGVRLRDLDGFAMLSLPREVAVDVGDDMRLEIPRGTTFTITPRFSGPPEAPVLQDFSVRALGDRGVTLRKKEGVLAPIAGIVIHSVDLLPGGALRVDYQPIPEQVIDGGISLFKLMVAAAGAAGGDARGLDALTTTRLPNTRLEGIRADVDAQIRDQIAPKLASWIGDNDGAIPGVSLVQVFAIQKKAP